jgi:hypothetical protein
VTAPEAVSFIVNTYVKLAKGETGITNAATRHVAANIAIDWILSEFPEDAVSFEAMPGGAERITIDWPKVPEYLRNPKLPARRR